LSEIVKQTTEQDQRFDKGEDQQAPDINDDLPGFLRAPLPSISSSSENDQALEPTTTANPFLDGIDFTYLNFASLLKIKSDTLISPSKIHQALWLKTLAQSRIAQHEPPHPINSFLVPTDDTAKINSRRLWQEFHRPRPGHGEQFRFGVEFSDLSVLTLSKLMNRPSTRVYEFIPVEPITSAPTGSSTCKRSSAKPARRSLVATYNETRGKANTSINGPLPAPGSRYSCL
jgi:hypothetical protein